MSLMIFLLMCFSLFAQTFQYRAEGSFPTTSGPGTPGTPSTVSYSLNWNETANSLQGLYRDDYFTQNGPSIVTGSVNDDGRKWNVILSESVNGVKSINLSTASRATRSGSIPVKVVTADTDGKTVDSPPLNMALLSAINENISRINTNECDVGFGVLSGFCGLYDGTFYEVSDPFNRCQLLTAGNPRLKIGEDTVLTLYLNYIKGSPTQSSHTIGTLPPSPASNNVDITSRNCTDLPGTTFSRGNCHTLNLSGDFRREAGEQPRFSGTYTITDDVNGESCSYALSLTKSE